jgi:hypothetical protein
VDAAATQSLPSETLSTKGISPDQEYLQLVMLFRPPADMVSDMDTVMMCLLSLKTPVSVTVLTIVDAP